MMRWIKGKAELNHNELRVLELVATEGLSTRLIAQRLGMKQNTVRDHAQNILEKTESKRLAQAVFKTYAIEKDEDE